MEKLTQALKDYGLDPIEVFQLPNNRFALSINMAFNKTLSFEETERKVVEMVKAIQFLLRLGPYHLMAGEYLNFHHFIVDFDKAD